jgi:thiamine biosynthesis lipoprotein
MESHEFRAMNTGILLVGEGRHEAVETGFGLAQKFIEDSEKRFTRFSSQSELSSLNQSAGGWFDASKDMFEVVSLAIQLYRQTTGLFDPSILEALEQAGYDRSMDEIRLVGPTKVTVMARPKLHHFSEVRLDEPHCRIALPREMRIDLGGIAKSWIAEKAAMVLSEWTEACAVDAGGDMFFIGLPPGEKAWQVTLEDPLDEKGQLAVLKVSPGAVATSTVTKRRWKQDGKEQHHLIDPRTQQPAETDWLSVTVVADHAASAEVYAKSLLIGGPQAVEQLTRRAGAIEFIAIDHEKKLWGSKHSLEILNV